MGQSCVTQLEDRSCKNPTFTNYSNDVVNNVQRAEKKQEKTVLLSFDNLDKQIIEFLLARSKKFHLGITHSQSRTSEEHNQVFLNYALNFWHGMQDSKQPFRLNPPADIRIRFGSNYQYEIDQQKQWIFGLEDKVFHFMAIGKSSDFDTTILTQFARKGNITPSKQFQKAIKTLLLKYLNRTLASRFQSVCKSLKCCILVNALHLCSNQSIQKVSNMKIQFRKDGLKHDDEKIILRLCSIDWQDQVRDCVHNARDLVGQIVRLRPGIEPYTSIGWFVWYSFHSCLQPQQQLWELFLFYVGNVFETGRFFDFALEKMLLYTASEVIKECDFEAAILCCKWNNYVESIELNLVALNANVALNGIDICHVTMDSITAAMAITAREFEQYLVTNKVIHVSLQHQQQFEECLSNQVNSRVNLLIAWSMWFRLHFSPWFVEKEWITYVHGMMDFLEICFSRCCEECVYCSLKCMEVACHPSIWADVHNCLTDHKCKHACELCTKGCPQFFRVARCCKGTNHFGKHVCSSYHDCGEYCENSDSSTCGLNCILPYDHEGKHSCGVLKHSCPKVCQGSGCTHICTDYIENAHAIHACQELRCAHGCAMHECRQRCSSLDHFHGQDSISDQFRPERIRSMGLTHMAMFDHIASAPHQCKFSHQCPETCDLPGNCILQLRDSHDNVVHIIDSALDRATWKALQIQDLLNLINSSRNGISLKLNLVSVRQRCSERLLPCARSHEGVHYCSMNVCSHNENDYMRYASPHRDFERSIRAHFCEECCPRCGGSCIYPVGHHGPHTTIHAVSADDQMDCAEYCHIKSHEHYVECWKPMQCPFQAYEECGDGIIHRVSHSRFWSLLRWQDPSWRKYKSQVEVATLKDRYEDFQCVKNSDILESVKQRHFIFALDCSDTMIGEPWKRMLVSMHSFIHRISPSRVECNTKQWRGCNNDVISVMTFNKEARWFCTELSVQLFLDCEKAITFRGGRKRYTAALRLIGEALKKNEHTRYTSVVFIYTDGKKGERFDALNDFAEKFRCRHSDGLNGFEVVGHGDVRMAFLVDFAYRLGARCTTKT